MNNQDIRIEELIKEELIKEELTKQINLDVPDRKMFRIDQAADYFNVKKSTIRNWIRNKKIGYEKLGGGAIRIPRQSIIEYRLKAHIYCGDEFNTF